MFIFLIVLFIVLPIAELWVIIELGGAIGIWPTLALLFLDSVLGAVLVRSQGRAAWLRFQQVLGTARVPAKEVYDGAAIIFGGALLLTPGFITDIVGFLLLIPPTRAALRRFLLAIARRFGPMRSVFFVYDRRPGSWRSQSDGDPQAPPRTPPSGSGGSTGQTPGGSRPYDFEGSAREIPDDAPELDPGAKG